MNIKLETIKELDLLAAKLEKKYSPKQITDYVATSLAEKFIKQQDKLNQAIEADNESEIIKHSQAMIKGWMKLDEWADSQTPGEVWEVEHPSGKVISVYKNEVPEEYKKDTLHINIKELVKFMPANILMLAAAIPKPEITKVTSKEWDDLIDDEIPF
ncbi:MAG: hypothetical protein GOVbin1230_20 [Prokaryotic dsDNA virus sp.]|nr:MAG: hypothetical protein GOVbin1230_20 [Prokaryotic dsDNA virus sp.]|tara:strand:- start:685 stop:1155 length:471 start_codon:yes stop_codon:yes gene_type:complete